MSNPIRVLVVDDSATTREVIAAILHSAPGIQVIGEAANGREGVEMAERLRPDIITMDVNMPVMNGDQATQAIMERTPTPILVVTTVTQAEMVRRGFDILVDGALDIIQKPSSLTAQGFDAIRAELIDKVKTLSRVKFVRPW